MWLLQAASKSLVDATKLAINEGRYTGCDDVHVLATLLKVGAAPHLPLRIVHPPTHTA